MKEHRGGWTIALEYLVRHQSFHLFIRHGTPKFGSDLVGGFTKGHSLGLSKVVGKEDGVVVSGAIKIFNYIVLSFDGREKIAGDYFGALVDKLVECVLAVLCMTGIFWRS